MIIMFSIHVIAWKGLNIYEHVPWFDFPEHFAGGLVTAWTLYRLYLIGQNNWKFTIQPQGLLYLFLIGMTALVAVLWEFHEFAHDVLFPNLPPYQLGQWDTMHDLFMGILGATVWCIRLHFAPRKKIN